MDDLLLAGGANAMNVHSAALHDVKSVGGVAFVEKIIAFSQRLQNGDFGNRFQIRLGQAGEKLAAPQRVNDGDSFEFSQRNGHGSIQSISRQK